jgi:hypothetical protein
VVLLGLFAALTLAVVCDFVVFGTTVPVLVICSVFNGALKPDEAEEAPPPVENGSND